MPNSSKATLPPPRRIYWDSCVYIDYFEETPDKIQVLESVVDEIQRNKDSIIYTSALTITEVSFASHYRQGKTLDPATEAAIDAAFNDINVNLVVEVNTDIAIYARNLMRRANSKGWEGLKPPDAIHLASAQWLGVEEFHTYDKALLKYTELIGLEVCSPNALQGLLPEID